MPHGLLLGAFAHWPDHGAAAHEHEVLLLSQAQGHRAATFAAFIGEKAYKSVPKIHDDNGLPRHSEDWRPLCCNKRGDAGDFEVCQKSCKMDPRFAKRKANAKAKVLAKAKVEAEAKQNPAPHRPGKPEPPVVHYKRWWDLYLEGINNGGIGLANKDDKDGPISLLPHRHRRRARSGLGYLQ
mmetsp:Transcript_2856/g.5652  ORF Transcript_2856/g.5652 Transcript_2856/m.5652 type:complete len:182 (-) Transcript_2856:119-664(-)